MSAIPQTYPVPLTPEQVNSAESSQWLQLARQLSVDIRVATPASLLKICRPASRPYLCR